ncbi:hypothetical protein [Halomonas elongata]|uniref:hypothetical protein n=2 Tax=Halomonas elongata TaxID=2746 RepID=UPI001CECA2C0|nr:hypothetical protein [Halomonas elongata]MBW5800220.1 hypothetical protein [Halomonas elongata]
MSYHRNEETPMFKNALLALSLLLLAGCASSGNQTLKDQSEASVSQVITEGVTTQSEVKQTFGSPMETSFTDNGLEIWEYSLSEVSADAINFVPIVNLFGSSASGKKKDLTILFDETDVVQRYSMTSSDVSHKTGLFR